jgi:putative Ca2+/H+ antiporter (TMEM165/GDT1 family)
MDWKVYLATFTAVFLAELADKTQLVGIGMVVKSGRPFSVWLGSVSAYLIITAVSVALGMLFTKYIKPEFIRYFAGILFVIMGFLMFSGKI